MTLPTLSHTRRRFLARAGTLGLATPLGLLGSPSSAGLLPVPALGDAPICRVAAEGPAPGGAARPIKLAWNASAICTAAAPVAKESGVFARHGLAVEFVNFGGSTEQLLEAIATGKADAGIGMALRWLKPLEQGFDVKVTAGIHGGCMRLLGARSAGATSLDALKGKVIAVSDQASPAKNFFGLLLAKRGIDPERDVEWRVYPLDLLALAVEKGEAQALADSDPRTFLWMKDTRLTEVANNLSAEYHDRTCCILALRGALVRDERPVAAALTRALLEAGTRVAHDPDYAAKVYAGYGGKGSVEDLAAMLRSHTHHHHPLGAELKQQIAAYVDELKTVKVIRARTDARQFAERVYADVLS
ncbi:hypothetical protein MPEAHAMD_2507 [Methylobacterium frigidaeris]|uniref:ABC transporter substrate-binding protein n=2 Tax=Methylobacterium frigidaeris TaxID=2038277 RepID=A0AA37HAM9_9HYPH|nr:ABC transporter substrate-binding protein [Methylobacterium frigidaeris]GJD62354.1 hypothetical protein MPEAHAMD_2507 [Methylobacterium frigidaeris]